MHMRVTVYMLLSRASLLTVFFFTDTATTELYTLSLHDALPISAVKSFWRFSQTDLIWEVDHSDLGGFTSPRP